MHINLRKDEIGSHFVQLIKEPHGETVSYETFEVVALRNHKHRYNDSGGFHCYVHINAEAPSKSLEYALSIDKLPVVNLKKN